MNRAIPFYHGRLLEITLTVLFKTRYFFKLYHLCAFSCVVLISPLLQMFCHRHYICAASARCGLSCVLSTSQPFSFNHINISSQSKKFILCPIISYESIDQFDQGYNARKVNCSCVHIETSSLSAEFVNKNRCFSVRLVSDEDKSITFFKFL